MPRKLSIPLWIALVASALLVARALSLPGHGSSADTRRDPSEIRSSAANANPSQSWSGGQGLQAIGSVLGSIVVDNDGYTIYRFDQPVDKERTDPRVDPLPERRLVSCDGGSPAGWPSVIYSESMALRGIDHKLIGFLERADGTRQLTIRGCPVYRFVGDHEPGQVTGHCFAGIWYAVTPTGMNATTGYCRGIGYGSR
jgi:predicted lipoprotein with Yx(FWY)xxD motif